MTIESACVRSRSPLRSPARSRSTKIRRNPPKSEPLIYSRDGAGATVAINDPPFNPMGLDFMDALDARVDEIAADDGIRAVVLTAAGDRHFSVGMNLKQLSTGIERKGSADALFDQRLDVIARIESMAKPWIATLFGYCLGGGLELPLGCHFRLAAAEGAAIGLPEIDLGAVPAWGGSARLARCVGRDRAIDMILRARKITGPEALQYGLVTEICPLAELKPRALQLAGELAAAPREAVATMLGCLVGFETKTLAESLADERRTVHACRGTRNAAEGMRAFLEKRAPLFNQD